MQIKKRYSRRPDVITDVSIGMSDGLVIPFILVSGLTAIITDIHIIIAIAVIITISGAVAMAMGGYFAGKAEADNDHADKDKMQELFTKIGLSAETQQVILQEMEKDSKEWEAFVAKYHLMDRLNPILIKKTAFNIGISYFIGGIIPIAPYFFIADPFEALKLSSVITILCMFIFGYLKGKFTGQNPWVAAMRITVLGVLAAVMAYYIACIFT